MSDLSERQQKFARYLGMLLVWIYEQPGYSAVVGEVKRPHEMEELYLKEGKSRIQHSFHEDCLAVDIFLFINSIYQDKAEAYKYMGDYWKSLDPENVWGGDWLKLHDGNHFQHGGKT